MLDFFTIFTKGGIVLWCFQNTSAVFTSSINNLIRSVVLQERGGMQCFEDKDLAMRYRQNNEFELVFVVAYQRILQLSYMDKFLTSIEAAFRDKYKQQLLQGLAYCRNIDFNEDFNAILQSAEETHMQSQQIPRKMRTFDQSEKSKKTIASMTNKVSEKEMARQKQKEKIENKLQEEEIKENILSVEDLQKNRAKLFLKKKTPKSPNGNNSNETETSPKPKGKAQRQWSDRKVKSKEIKNLDFSETGSNGAGGVEAGFKEGTDHYQCRDEDVDLVGKMKGNIQDMEDLGDEEQIINASKKTGLLSSLSKLVSSGPLTTEDIAPALDKVKEQLITKNVASDVAEKLCESIRCKLSGKSIGTFTTIASTVRQCLHESCVQILSPRLRVDFLREAIHARQKGRPYTIVFCGVNGVGKSTNLSKVANWLIENGLTVMIAACDTFRAGAVEQLRTHVRRLNSMHPAGKGGQQMVQLYEKGYGKDAAGIALEAINYGRESRVDVVLIDTAGRMQDNEPLMRALAKLVTINQPDFVLFVGEALVGNEAIDQLMKFNETLADMSTAENPHLIDGILLTKFDTVDDKVGAAISMTYITGKPIVFIGTGQTYTDLKNLNANSIVNSLLK